MVGLMQAEIMQIQNEEDLILFMRNKLIPDGSRKVIMKAKKQEQDVLYTLLSWQSLMYDVQTD